MSSLNVQVHLLWGTRKRKPFLNKDIRYKVFDHILKNAKTKGINIVAINGHLDHVHVLMSISPTQNIAELVQLLKGETSYWINQNHLTGEKFRWQRRYWGVGIGLSEIERIKNYIKNQEDHHRKITYKEEVEAFIESYKLDSFDDD